MAQPVPFPSIGARRPTPPVFERSLGDKLQEIAGRSRKHLKAFEVLVDLVINELNEHDHAQSG